MPAQVFNIAADNPMRGLKVMTRWTGHSSSTGLARPVVPNLNRPRPRPRFVSIRGPFASKTEQKGRGVQKSNVVHQRVTITKTERSFSFPPRCIRQPLGMRLSTLDARHPLVAIPTQSDPIRLIPTNSDRKKIFFLCRGRGELPARRGLAPSCTLVITHILASCWAGFCS